MCGSSCKSHAAANAAWKTLAAYTCPQPGMLKQPSQPHGGRWFRTSLRAAAAGGPVLTQETGRTHSCPTPTSPSLCTGHTGARAHKQPHDGGRGPPTGWPRTRTLGRARSRPGTPGAHTCREYTLPCSPAHSHRLSHPRVSRPRLFFWKLLSVPLPLGRKCSPYF